MQYQLKRSDVEIGCYSGGMVVFSLERISLNSFKANNLQSFSAFSNTDADESFFINKLLEEFKLKSNFVNPIEF